MRYQTVVITCFYVIQLVLFNISLTVADTNQTHTANIKFVWQSQNPSLIESQKSFLERHGAEVGNIEEIDQSRGATGAILFTLAVTASVCVLADTLVQAVKDYEHGGIVFDFRKADSLIAHESQNLKRGQVLLIKPDGEVKFEESQSPDASKSLCGLLVKALDVSNILKTKDKK